VISACYTGLAFTLTVRREDGILKRKRGTPLRLRDYIGGMIGSSLVVSAVLSAVTIAIGMIVFGVEFPDWAQRLPALIVVLLLGATCASAWGIAISALIPNQESAPAIINVLLFPLRPRSMVSMKKMQSLQPEVKAIQDRYAKYKVTDPERQKMNSEMLALYKQKGVNPTSGCVPMLLTFPILLALYNLLSFAIELRGAPFVGWIHDLSTKDPLYIWPVLMGGTMFWQQKMMPSNADPLQQKIFLLLPVVFTVMFLNMPSGLVIYWLTSNLLTVGQQYVTNRIVAGPARPARAK
jgi:YidC/Oxa1 family membrane protein insertase